MNSLEPNATYMKRICFARIGHREQFKEMLHKSFARIRYREQEKCYTYIKKGVYFKKVIENIIQYKVVSGMQCKAISCGGQNMMIKTT